MYEIGTLINKIAVKSGLSIDEVEKRINDKILEFSGLISKSGAAFLIAKEFGLTLRPWKGQLRIKNIVNGMSSVEFEAQVMALIKNNDIIDVVLGDGTGKITLTLSGDQKKLLKDIAVGDVVVINGAYAVKGGLRLGKEGEISHAGFSRIDEIEEGSAVKVRGIFLSVRLTQGKMTVLSGILDDGFGSIRCVFFGSMAKKVLEVFGKQGKAEVKFVLGKEIVVCGVVKRNAYTSAIELIGNKIHSVIPHEIIKTNYKSFR